MEQNNNIYGEIINSKFTHLLSADKNVTWKGMKELLDKEIPQKKKKKWLFWFTTKTGIIAIILFTLCASAASVYFGDSPDQQEKEAAIPVKGIPKELKPEIITLKEVSINNNNAREIVKIRPEKKRSSLQSTVENTCNKTLIASSETHEEKVNDITVEERMDIKASMSIVHAKDSVNAPAVPSRTPEVRKRAF